MWYIRSAQIRKVTLGILLIGLFFLVACGQAAPATPEPTEAPATDVGGTGAEATDTPVPDVEPTQPPAGDSKPAAGRLAVAMSPPVHELVLAWMGTTSDANLNARHFVEPLVETDNQTGELVSGLATDWEMTSPDGKTWTFKLKEGVPFHNGFGEFSAQDVPHTLAMNTQDEAIGTDTSLLRDLLGETEEEMRQNVETPDDQTVVFNLLEPRSDMGFIASAQQGNMLMYSKAQWDQEGEEGYNSQPAGTGSWQLVGRQLGQSIDFEAVENHWRKTPEFKELQLRWVTEAATRLAMILSGEVQMSEVDRDLHKEAVAQGKEVVNSQLPAVAFGFVIGGVYHPDMPTYDPDVPAVNVKVREAINRAINRQELIDTLLAGQAELHKVWGYHPSMDGWNPEWDAKFDEMYSYDPERARQALQEAGFEGFKVTVVITSLPGAPEMIDAAQALDLYLKDIGVQSETVEMEFARLREQHYRPAQTHNLIYPIRGTYRPQDVTLRFYNISGEQGFHRAVPDKILDEKYEQYVDSVDPEERERLLQEIGDFKLENYVDVPVAWIPGQIVVDPAAVAEYVFPGNINGIFSHFEHARPAR